jgi:hypothetical protein
MATANTRGATQLGRDTATELVCQQGCAVFRARVPAAFCRELLRWGTCRLIGVEVALHAAKLTAVQSGEMHAPAYYDQLYTLVEAAERKVETITVDEARASRGDEAVFIDIRELNREGRMPGAFYCPRDMLEFGSIGKPVSQAHLYGRQGIHLFCVGLALGACGTDGTPHRLAAHRSSPRWARCRASVVRRCRSTGFRQDREGVSSVGAIRK